MTPIEQFIQLLIDLPVNALNFTWSIINPILIDNWKFLLISIIILLIIATIKFFLTQQWGTLGSLLYNIFFFGIMYFIINKFGPDLILEDYFKTISFLIYFIGFFLTRIILKKLKIKSLPNFHS
jgi:membrane-bound ClpP family serine protease